jgi:hypothetical protein
VRIGEPMLERNVMQRRSGAGMIFQQQTESVVDIVGRDGGPSRIGRSLKLVGAKGRDLSGRNCAEQGEDADDEQLLSQFQAPNHLWMTGQ